MWAEQNKANDLICTVESYIDTLYSLSSKNGYFFCIEPYKKHLKEESIFKPTRKNGAPINVTSKLQDKGSSSLSLVIFVAVENEAMG